MASRTGSPNPSCRLGTAHTVGPGVERPQVRFGHLAQLAQIGPEDVPVGRVDQTRRSASPGTRPAPAPRRRPGPGAATRRRRPPGCRRPCAARGCPPTARSAGPRRSSRTAVSAACSGVTPTASTPWGTTRIRSAPMVECCWISSAAEWLAVITRSARPAVAAMPAAWNRRPRGDVGVGEEQGGHVVHGHHNGCGPRRAARPPRARGRCRSAPAPRRPGAAAASPGAATLRRAPAAARAAGGCRARPARRRPGPSRAAGARPRRVRSSSGNRPGSRLTRAAV